MITSQFVGQNIHFAINLLAALVFFAVFWLYFDAWIGQADKPRKAILNWLGFLLTSLSFIPAATFVEQLDAAGTSYAGGAALVSAMLRLIGYACIIAGQLADPLQPRPVTKSLEEEYAASAPPSATPPQSGTPVAPSSTPAVLIPLKLAAGVLWTMPVAAFAIAALYWRRATTGLERHLRPVAIAFAFLFIFELCSLAVIMRGTANPQLYDLVKAFGPIWTVSQLGLLCGVMVLGRWVWRYLTERFISQLFMTFISVVLGVFLITTVSFTFLLLQNIQTNALHSLSTATSVLNYALDSRKAAAQANAEALAASPTLATAVSAKNHTALISLTGNFLANKQLSSLVITAADGEVLLRAEDPARWGDSISSDTLVRRSLIGRSSATIESRSSVLAPVLTIRAVVPARDANGTVIGSVSASTVISNGFLDGVKQSTGLEASVYSGDVRSATTFASADGVTRQVGIKEANSTVTGTVLKHGRTYQGDTQLLNRAYLAAYAPLKDADNTVIGMLFIGTPEHDILATTTHLISLTFIVAAVLLLASIIPAYLIARHITKQLG